MRVRELIAILNDLENKDRLVVIQKKAEGNVCSPLCDIDDASNYHAETTHRGYAKYEKLTPQLEMLRYTEDDVSEDGEPCLVLCPVMV